MSVSWHWNTVNEAIKSLPKDVLNNFTKTIFSLRDMISIVLDQQPVIHTQPAIFT